MSGFVWLVAEGDCSDYQVHCVFEREQDAEQFVFATNRNEIQARHNSNVANDETPANTEYKCVDPIETCPGCHDVWATGEWRLYTERRPWHPARSVHPPANTVPADYADSAE